MQYLNILYTMGFQSLEIIILQRICAYAMSMRCICNDIEEFDKYRLNNDFEYEWKKIYKKRVNCYINLHL